MTFSEIINNNCEKHCKVKWWPRFAYHYTDVTNAVNILSSVYLYSRADATSLRLMNNDNASKQVIDMTNPEVSAQVRLYFRPLTPTQYYNEGYKHPSIRYDNDPNANTPVPIFFLFDLESLLSSQNACFSEKTQAGNRSPLLSGPNDFSKLNFDYIYSTGYDNYEEALPYRHAEVLYSGSMQIEPFLKKVLCRNNIERLTLLNLLKEKNNYAYMKFKDFIQVFNENLFENNGLFISNCLFIDNNISITFADNYAKNTYVSKMKERNNVQFLPKIKMGIEINWFNSRTNISQLEISDILDYEKPLRINITNLKHEPRANELGVKVFFEDKLMCYYKQPLESAELIK